MKVLIPSTVDEAVKLIRTHFKDESVLGADTETYGLNNVTPFSIQLANDSTCIYINLNQVPDVDGKLLPFIPAIGDDHIKRGLNSYPNVAKYYKGKPHESLTDIFKELAGKTLVFHNAKFDIRMLDALDTEIINTMASSGVKVFCTMQFFMTHIQPGRYAKLKDLLIGYKCGTNKSDKVDEWFKENPSHNYEFYKVPVKTIVEYASIDAVSVFELYCKMLDEIQKVRVSQGSLEYAYAKISR